MTDRAIDMNKGRWENGSVREEETQAAEREWRRRRRRVWAKQTSQDIKG